MVLGVCIRGPLATVAALAVILLPVPSAHGASDFGSNLVTPSEGVIPCPGLPCSWWNETLHPANVAGTLTSPISGVLVSFTIREQASPGSTMVPFHIRVVDRLTADPDPLWRGLAATSPDVKAANVTGMETFPARVPIVVGDYLAIEFGSDVGNVPIYAGGVFGATSRYRGSPLPADGSPVTANSITAEILLRGRVEPDSDADGFGDETQDNCPGQGRRQRRLHAAKKKCKRKKGKKKSALAKKKKKKGCKKRRKKRK